MTTLWPNKSPKPRYAGHYKLCSSQRWSVSFACFGHRESRRSCRHDGQGRGAGRVRGKASEFDFGEIVSSRQIDPGWLFDANGIACPVVLNLKGKKIVYGFQRIRVMRHNPYHAAFFRRHKSIGNRTMFFLHYGNTGRDCIVDKHRHSKIIRAKH